MTTLASPAGTDVVPIVDLSGTPTTKKATVSSLLANAYTPGGTDVAIADGGTGASTATLAFNALSPTTTQGDISYHNGTDDVRLAKGTALQLLRMNSGVTAPEWGAVDATMLPTVTRTRTINFIIDGGGSAITTGIKGDVVIDAACTIQSVTLLADQSGSIVIDIWKDTYANFAPTVADTITASAKPTITTATKSQDSTLTGWTTSVTAGDILRFNVDSITTVTRVTLALKVLV